MSPIRCFPLIIFQQLPTIVSWIVSVRHLLIEQMLDRPSRGLLLSSTRVLISHFVTYRRAFHAKLDVKAFMARNLCSIVFKGGERLRSSILAFDVYYSLSCEMCVGHWFSLAQRVI